jgi:hypothetical protein
MMKNKIFLIVACLFGSLAYGQNNTNLGEETVFTFGDRKLTLGDAFKINISPAIYDSVVKIEEPTYLFTPRKFNTAYQITPILPARLRVMEPLSKLQRVYVKAGMGMYTTPLLQLRINQLRSKKSQVGLAFDHLSSNGGIKEVSSSKFSNNNVGVWGKFLGKKLTVESKLNYDRYARHFYGYEPLDSIVVADEIAQLINKIGGTVELKSSSQDSSEIHFTSLVGFSNLTDSYYVNEMRVIAKNSFSKFHDKEWYNLDVNVDYNQLKSVYLLDTSAHIQNNAIVEVTPQIISKGDKIKVQVGLSIQGNMDKTAKFHFYPRAELSYSLFNNVFIPYAGLKGGLNRNNWSSSFMENPFISSHLELRNTNDKLIAYGGIKGTLSSSTSFNLMVSNKKVTDVALFVNDTIGGTGNRYALIYDGGRMLTVTGELNYHKGTQTEVYLNGAWYDYGFSTEGAWNLPSYKVGLGARFAIRSKFKVGAEIYYFGERDTRVISSKSIEPVEFDTVKQLKAFADININFEYRYTKRLSVFIQLNNLGNTNYQRWYRYQSMPLTAIGGFTYSF